MLWKLYKFAASLWLLVILLSVMAAILAFATYGAIGYDVTAGSLRRDWYGSWWFLPLMGLLMVNLVCCTVIRKPWRFWQWGFLVTHSGVLTLMIGATISFQFKIYGDMRLVKGSSAAEFEVEGERELIVKAGDGREQRVPVEINPYVRSKPGIGRAVGKGLLLYIDEYVPNISTEPWYEQSPDGTLDVLELTMDAASEKSTVFARFGRPSFAFGRMITVIPLRDEPGLFANLSGAAGPKGTLVVTVDGTTTEIDVAANIDKVVRVGSRDVIPRKLIQSFSLDRAGNPVDSDDGHESNPAVLFDTVADGKTESWYSIFLSPDLSPLLKGASFHNRTEPPFKAQLRYSPRDSAIWLFALKDAYHYVITSRKGEKHAGTVEVGQRVKHPFMPMEAGFTFVRRLDHAIPTVKEEPPKKGVPMNPAVRIRLSRAPEQQSQWVPLLTSARVEIGGEPVDISFLPRTYPDLGFQVTLRDFRSPTYDGSTRFEKFESDLEIFDPATRNVVTGMTGVNYPFSYKGWVFYQASFVPDADPPVSILQVSHDPGKRILYLGFVMTASGTIFMFYLRGILVKLVKPAQGAKDLPMTVGAQYLWLTVGCIGTIAGTLVKFALRDDAPAIGVGCGMAAVAIGAGFGLAAFAKAQCTLRPGWALQLGQIISATWIINTAALVVFMFMQVSG